MRMTSLAANPPPAPASYRYTRADLWLFARKLYRPSWRGFLVRIAFMIVCLASGIVLGAGGWPRSSVLMQMAGDRQLLVLVGALLLFSLFGHYLSAAYLMLRYRQLAIAEKQVTLHFGNDALTADIEGTKSEVPWSAFKRLDAGRDATFLFLARYEAISVPRRAFPDEAAYHAALQFLREKVSHATS